MDRKIRTTLVVLMPRGTNAEDTSGFIDEAIAGENPSLLHTLYILKNADADLSIMYGAICALALAFILSLATNSLNISKAVDAAMDGMSRMFPAVVILILAWTLSHVMQDLKLAEVARC